MSESENIVDNLDLKGTKKIRELITTAIIDVCKEVPDAYGILGDEEKEKLKYRAERLASDIETKVASRLGTVVEISTADGRPYFMARVDSYTVKDGEIKLTVKTPQNDYPEDAYHHPGNIMCQLWEHQPDLLKAVNETSDEQAEEGSGDLFDGEADHPDAAEPEEATDAEMEQEAGGGNNDDLQGGTDNDAPPAHQDPGSGYFDHKSSGGEGPSRDGDDKVG